MNIQAGSERNLNLISWGISGVFMLLLFLLLSLFHVAQPRQEDVPAETLLRWVRTIVPTNTSEAVRRVRVRERLSERIPFVQPKLRETGRRALAPMPSPSTPANSEARQPESLDRRLPERGRRSARVTAIDDFQAVGDGNRNGSSLDLGSGPAAIDRSASSRGKDNATELKLANRAIDGVLARYLGCEGSSFPAGQVRVEGKNWDFWLCEDGSVTRILLKSGKDLHQLVLGEGMLLQGHRRGVLEGSGSGIVRSLHATIEEARPFSSALTAFLGGQP